MLSLVIPAVLFVLALVSLGWITNSKDRQFRVWEPYKFSVPLGWLLAGPMHPFVVYSWWHLLSRGHESKNPDAFGYWLAGIFAVLLGLGAALAIRQLMMSEIRPSSIISSALRSTFLTICIATVLAMIYPIVFQGYSFVDVLPTAVFGPIYGTLAAVFVVPSSILVFRAVSLRTV